MKRLLLIAFWSVLAAAFIGPGTVTTAAKAGASFGAQLLWALTFSTFACLLLQEASARLTIATGHSLAEALRNRYSGAGGALILVLVLGAVVLGCAAYEAGNILGAVAGARLAWPVTPAILTGILGLAAGILLWLGSPRTVALVLSVLVALMGCVFAVTAWQLKPDLDALLRGAWVPSLPAGSGVLALGLVGTTVVPYNLFLGSGLARGQKLSEMRFGLTVAIVLGGLISMAVLVVGTAVVGEFGFAALARVLEERLGSWSGPLFAAGLFAAGFSSAVTAPLAAALTARGLFASAGREKAWGHRGWHYRGVWLAVLGTGVTFGLVGASPIPVILLAQAFNGVLLPFIAVFLLLAVNDRQLMGDEFLNGLWANLASALVVVVSLALGLTNVARAGARALDMEAPPEGALLVFSLGVALLLAIPVARQVRAGAARVHRDPSDL